ncbi:MAG TPA: hypothetical protein PKG70_12625 [Chitinophagales bacterium]|nr:hypothetical protein [Chitinophagales bacterium]HNK12850.1 hypothetical protein [Chitinophagales bacterium]HNK75691.1 hypothetical protein [Chitinophagales bacterium]HNL58476.1 hypothetical protein [Chitinophagales bacterium]
MDTKKSLKKIINLISMAVTAILISCSCGKDNIIRYETRLNFLYPVSITPNSDTINVGDTLWIDVNLPDSIYDNTNNRKFYLPSFDFQSYMSVRKLVDKTIDYGDQQYAASKFNTFNQVGNISIGGAFAIDYLPVYQNNHYVFKGAIIPKDTGVYCLVFTNLSYEQRLTDFLGLEQIKSLAPNANRFNILLDFIDFKINNGNTHYNIFTQHCKSNNDAPSNLYWKEENYIYTFVVK